MPNYIKADLHKFYHTTALESQDAPHQQNSTTYGTATQYSNPECNSDPLPTEGTNVVSKIMGNFLYYTLAVDSTILVTLINLVATQAKATEQT